MVLILLEDGSKLVLGLVTYCIGLCGDFDYRDIMVHMLIFSEIVFVCGP